MGAAPELNGLGVVIGGRKCRWCGVLKLSEHFYKGYKCRACYNRLRAEKRAAVPEFRERQNAAVKARRARSPEKARLERNESMRRHRERNRVRPLDIGDAHLPKKCAPETSRGCGEVKTRGEFYRNTAETDQRSYWCKVCQDQHGAAYRATCRAAWGGPDGQDCYLCGDVIGDAGQASVDHIVPQRDGGSDDASNLAWVHPACNSRKNARPATAEQLSRLALARAEDSPA